MLYIRVRVYDTWCEKLCSNTIRTRSFVRTRNQSVKQIAPSHLPVTDVRSKLHPVLSRPLVLPCHAILDNIKLEQLPLQVPNSQQPKTASTAPAYSRTSTQQHQHTANSNDRNGSRLKRRERSVNTSHHYVRKCNNH